MTCTRRQFLGASALAMVSAAPALGAASTQKTVREPKTIRPPKLAPGSKVLLIAPAGALGKGDDVEAAVAKLRGLELEVEIAPHLYSRFGYLAGTDEERAADVNEGFRRKDIHGLISIRGGYGCARILPLLDYPTIRANPKPLTGYSDITALHLALLAQAGLISFHGPVAGSTYTDYSSKSWFATLREGTAPIVMPVLPGAEPPRTLETKAKPNRVKGRIIGGNLSVFVSLFGTPYMPRLNGAILFFEDIGEDPYRVDRMLTQLKLAGIFDRAAAIIFGRFTNRSSSTTDDPGPWSIDQVLQDRTYDLRIPVGAGFAIGHVADKLTVAQGAKFEFDPTTTTLTQLEAGVR